MKKFISAVVILSSLVLSGVNVSDYGAGPMLKPARTFYVSTRGNDKNKGTSLKEAFRTLHKGVSVLRAGDTLLIEEGRYFQSEVRINVYENKVGVDTQCGKPGSPIRIMGMKGHKVTLVGGEIVKPVKQQGQLAEFKCTKLAGYKMVQELPSGIELQVVENEELVKKFPGTFYFDKAKEKLTVHFAAVDQKEVSIGTHRVGMRIHGSYIHVENLEFRYFYEGIYARMNRPWDKNKASHITIKDCNFYWNYNCGVVLDGTSWSLLKNNRGAFNTTRGNFMTLQNSKDNLIIGNWSGPTTQTLRHMPRNAFNYGINSYGGNPPRNHVIANLIESEYSFRWKGAGPGNIFRDNIVKGRFHVESKQLPLLIDNNYFGGTICYYSVGSNCWEKEFAPTPMKFTNNTRKLSEFKPKSKELAIAQKLKVNFPEPKFPKVVFTGLKACHITAESAVLAWESTDNDGFASAEVWKKGTNKKRWIQGTETYGVDQAVSINKLSPGTEYCYRAYFKSRRGGKWVTSANGTFKTALKNPPPRVLEVGKGKLSLAEAGLAARPGDTIKLLPGNHVGQLILHNSGTPEKPILIKGDRKATIDGAFFYAPLFSSSFVSNFTIDGVNFVNLHPKTGKSMVRLNGGSNITIQNCRTSEIPWEAGGFILGYRNPNLTIRNNVIFGGSYPIDLSDAQAKIINNTIVDATMLSLLLWSPVSMEIRNNIFYRPCAVIKKNTAMLLQNISGKIVSDGNVFWSPLKVHPVGGTIRNSGAKVLFTSKTLKEWQEKTGWDKNSMHIDPQFMDYKKGDFRLKPGSPAKGKGAVL